MQDDPMKAFGVAPGEDIWVFGYGSLMWQPGFDFSSRHKAVAQGYHRRFCIYSREYRGTPENPGLVLGLDDGGICEGVAFEVRAADAADVLATLWEREMTPPGIYLARRIPVLMEGRTQRACAFLVNPQHPDYHKENCYDIAAEIIQQASGQRGRNVEYLENTVHHLRSVNINDAGLEDLLARVKSRLG